MLFQIWDKTVFIGLFVVSFFVLATNKLPQEDQYFLFFSSCLPRKLALPLNFAIASIVVAMSEHGLKVITDRGFEVIFHGRKVGIFIPDLIVENGVIVELKSCEHLLAEHQAQLINYLAVTDVQVALLVNFRKRKLMWLDKFT